MPDRVDISTDRAMITNPQSAPDLATALSFENDDDGDGDLEFISADLAKSIAEADKMISAFTSEFRDIDESFSSADGLFINDKCKDEDGDEDENDKEINDKDNNDENNNIIEDNDGIDNINKIDKTKSTPQDPRKANGRNNIYRDDPGNFFSPCSDAMGPYDNERGSTCKSNIANRYGTYSTAKQKAFSPYNIHDIGESNDGEKLARSLALSLDNVEDDAPVPADETAPNNEDPYDFMQAIQNEFDRMESVLDKEMDDVMGPYDEHKSTNKLKQSKCEEVSNQPVKAHSNRSKAISTEIILDESERAPVEESCNDFIGKTNDKPAPVIVPEQNLVVEKSDPAALFFPDNAIIGPGTALDATGAFEEKHALPESSGSVPSLIEEYPHDEFSIDSTDFFPNIQSAIEATKCTKKKSKVDTSRRKTLGPTRKLNTDVDKNPKGKPESVLLSKTVSGRRTVSVSSRFAASMAKKTNGKTTVATTTKTKIASSRNTNEPSAALATNEHVQVTAKASTDTKSRKVVKKANQVSIVAAPKAISTTKVPKQANPTRESLTKKSTKSASAVIKATSSATGKKQKPSSGSALKTKHPPPTINTKIVPTTTSRPTSARHKTPVSTPTPVNKSGEDRNNAASEAVRRAKLRLRKSALDRRKSASAALERTQQLARQKLGGARSKSKKVHPLVSPPERAPVAVKKVSPPRNNIPTPGDNHEALVAEKKKNGTKSKSKPSCEGVSSSAPVARAVSKSAVQKRTCVSTSPPALRTRSKTATQNRRLAKDGKSSVSPPIVRTHSKPAAQRVRSALTGAKVAKEQPTNETLEDKPKSSAKDVSPPPLGPPKQPNNVTTVQEEETQINLTAMPLHHAGNDDKPDAKETINEGVALKRQPAASPSTSKVSLMGEHANKTGKKSARQATKPVTKALTPLRKNKTTSRNMSISAKVIRTPSPAACSKPIQSKHDTLVDHHIIDTVAPSKSDGAGAEIIETTAGEKMMESLPTSKVDVGVDGKHTETVSDETEPKFSTEVVAGETCARADIPKTLTDENPDGVAPLPRSEPKQLETNANKDFPSELPALHPETCAGRETPPKSNGKSPKTLNAQQFFTELISSPTRTPRHGHPLKTLTVPKGPTLCTEYRHGKKLPPNDTKGTAGATAVICNPQVLETQQRSSHGVITTEDIHTVSTLTFSLKSVPKPLTVPKAPRLSLEERHGEKLCPTNHKEYPAEKTRHEFAGQLTQPIPFNLSRPRSGEITEKEKTFTLGETLEQIHRKGFRSNDEPMSDFKPHKTQPVPFHLSVSKNPRQETKCIMTLAESLRQLETKGFRPNDDEAVSPYKPHTTRQVPFHLSQTNKQHERAVCSSPKLTLAESLRQYEMKGLRDGAGPKNDAFVPHKTQPVPFKLSKPNNPRPTPSPEKRRTLAEELAWYAHSGCRTGSPVPNRPKVTTVPVSPNITKITTPRRTLKSSAEIEEETLQYMATHQFKARPLNKSTGYGTIAGTAVGIPKINKKGLTTPEPFRLATDNRGEKTHNAHLSTPTQREIDEEECKKQFRARPLPDLNYRPPKQNKFQHRQVTTPSPFRLTSEERRQLAPPPATPDDIELAKQFHARPMPRFHPPQNTTPLSSPKPPVDPKSPKFCLSDRADKRKSLICGSRKSILEKMKKRLSTSAPSRRKRHNRRGLQASPVAPFTPTVPTPFNLHTEHRGEAHQAILSEKLKADEEQRRAVSNIRARKNPSKSTASPYTPARSIQPLTTPQQPPLQSLSRHEAAQRSFLDKLEKEAQERKQAMLVKARPLPSSTYTPSQAPVPPSAMGRQKLKPCPVTLHSEKRQLARKEFDESLQRLSSEKETMLKLQEEEFKKEMDMEMKMLRRLPVEEGGLMQIAKPIGAVFSERRQDMSLSRVSRDASSFGEGMNDLIANFGAVQLG